MKEKETYINISEGKITDCEYTSDTITTFNEIDLR